MTVVVSVSELFAATGSTGLVALTRAGTVWPARLAPVTRISRVTLAPGATVPTGHVTTVLENMLKVQPGPGDRAPRLVGVSDTATERSRRTLVRGSYASVTAGPRAVRGP